MCGEGLSWCVGGVAPHARTLLNIFEASVVRWPGNVALEASQQRLSYAALDREADDVAARLAAVGIGRSDRVGIRVPSGTTDLYIAILGVLRAGAAYVPVEFSDPDARAELLWGEAHAVAVVGERLSIAVRGQGGGETEPAQPNDDCWVIFTSGSTGTPKGVAVTHRSAAALVDGEAQSWRVRPTDRVQGALSVSFDASCEEMWLAWRNGAALVATPRDQMLSSDGGATWMHERRITVVSTIPSVAALWPMETWDRLHLVILGGEACSPQLASRVAGRTEVWNTYGPTEATVVSTAARLSSDLVTIGLPLPGWDVAVVDSDGEVVEAGEVGELVIAGVGLGRYLDPRLDTERFAPLPAMGWSRAYRTGDRVRLDTTGLEFVGRADDQVKINGRRIELGEIDAQLTSLPGVVSAACVLQETTAGIPVLVGYLVGEVDLDVARATLIATLPTGLVPLLTLVPSIPRGTSGKIARSALPWPIVLDEDHDDGDETSQWISGLVREQLGPVRVGNKTDFFELGGNSLAAAKFVSAVRARYPTVGIADLYTHRPLRAFIDRLNERPPPTPKSPATLSTRRHLRALQLVGVFGLLLLMSPQVLVPFFLFNRFVHVSWAPTLPFVDLFVIWLVFVSLPGRVLIVVALKRLLLGRVEPGRYACGGRVHLSFWFLERLVDLFSLDVVNGTPWAVRYARLLGASVDVGARLAGDPPIAGLLSVGAGSSVEAEAEIMNWCFDRDEIVVGSVTIGRDARIGARTCLLPGTVVHDDAEIESGACISGVVPGGERWAGSPGRRVGTANMVAAEGSARIDTPSKRRMWEAVFGLTTLLLPLLAVVAALPSLLLLAHIDRTSTTSGQWFWRMLVWSPVLMTGFLVLYACITVALVRLLSRSLAPGRYQDRGHQGYRSWLCGRIVDAAQTILFPCYGSMFTPAWLRMLGAQVGHNTEISTPVGIPSLLTVDDEAFIADDVRFATPISWKGWLTIDRVTVGKRAFVGNSATLEPGTVVGDDALIAVMCRAPRTAPAQSSWLGSPPLEFPRISQAGPLRQTFSPPTHLKMARASIEILRGLLCSVAGVAILAGVALSVDLSAHAFGFLAVIVATPVALAAAGLTAWVLTSTLKWLVAGRYRETVHPLWSLAVWRTEFVDMIHEQVAGTWLTPYILGTGLFNLYLRSLGARIGRDVWCDTWSLTEFDLIELGDGVRISKDCDLQTHLFHDRMMRTGTVRIGADSTVGTRSVLLPETRISNDVNIRPKSLVMRGEHLAPGTTWQGNPVVGQ
jgi:non-ribosomal peptide synthetase-like protein